MTNERTAKSNTKGAPYGSDANGPTAATLPPPLRAEMNELELAMQIQQSHQLLYNSKIKYFERYNSGSGLWEHQTDHRIKTHVLDHIAALQSQQRTTIPPLNVTKLVNAVGSILKYRVPEPPPRTEQHLVAVKNGVLDLSTDTVHLRRHDPAYHLTNGSPVEYNPKRTCQMFSSVLLGNGFSADDAALIQKYFGAVLLGANEAQTILILMGTAGIGKSTLVSIMEQVIGRDNVAYLRTQHLGGRFEMSAFLGKTLLVGKDVAQDFLSVKGARVLKSLVGGDFLQAERKSNNYRVDMEGNYHVAITCNSDIRVPPGGDQDAWQRRLLVVNSQREKPAKIIPNLAERILDEEASGVLNWLIEGAIAHKHELQRFGAYQLSARQKGEIQQMVEEPGPAHVTNRVPAGETAHA